MPGQAGAPSCQFRPAGLVQFGAVVQVARVLAWPGSQVGSSVGVQARRSSSGGQAREFAGSGSQVWSSMVQSPAF